jgi:hypothetical protein
VFPMRYELGFYIPEDDILHSHRRDILKSYIAFASLEPYQYTRRFLLSIGTQL